MDPKDRLPWSWNEIVGKWTPEQTSIAVAALKSDFHAIRPLIESISLNPKVSTEIVNRIPNAGAALLIDQLEKSGNVTSQSILDSGDWRIDQAQALAKNLAPNPKKIEELLQDKQIPPILQQALVDQLATTDPDALNHISTLSKEQVAGAAVKARQLTAYLESGTESVDKIFPNFESWKNVGLSPQIALDTAVSNASAFVDLDGWVQNTVANWLQDDPLKASNAIRRLDPGPVKDAGTLAIIDHTIRLGDIVSTRVWLQQLPEAKANGLLKQYPHLGTK